MVHTKYTSMTHTPHLAASFAKPYKCFQIFTANFTDLHSIRVSRNTTVPSVNPEATSKHLIDAPEV